MGRKSSSREHDGFLNGRLLIAMPSLTDRLFEKSVVLLCHHTPETAMGLILNKTIEGMTFSKLLRQLNIDVPASGARSVAIHAGGPVQTSRGFVLHSSDYANKEGTLSVASGIALTATMDVLKALAAGSGPNRAFFALGYAGWGAGQLETELQENAWLVGDADEALVFDSNLDTKWLRALARIGVDPAMVSGHVGRA